MVPSYCVRLHISRGKILKTEEQVSASDAIISSRARQIIQETIRPSLQTLRGVVFNES